MGMDYSVGKIYMPESDCHQLAELLLTNSHSLPTPCRNVGQFYVRMMTEISGLLLFLTLVLMPYFRSDFCSWLKVFKLKNRMVRPH